MIRIAMICLSLLLVPLTPAALGGAPFPVDRNVGWAEWNGYPTDGYRFAIPVIRTALSREALLAATAQATIDNGPAVEVETLVPASSDEPYLTGIVRAAGPRTQGTLALQIRTVDASWTGTVPIYDWSDTPCYPQVYAAQLKDIEVQSQDLKVSWVRRPSDQVEKEEVLFGVSDKKVPDLVHFEWTLVLNSWSSASDLRLECGPGQIRSSSLKLSNSKYGRIVHVSCDLEVPRPVSTEEIQYCWIRLADRGKTVGQRAKRIAGWFKRPRSDRAKELAWRAQRKVNRTR